MNPAPHQAANLWVIVLAGGSGTRLWPLSREQFPKQFLALDGGRSLIELTIARIADRVPRERILIVTSAEHALGAGFEALRGLRTLLEPVGRNTAPALALANRWIRRQDPSALCLVLPSDHLITDLPAFQAALAIAERTASAGWLVTFGILPTRAETGYGYIRIGGALETAGAFAAERFVEKPDRPTAEAYLASGAYLWNSGMFVWPAALFGSELAAHCPEVDALAGEIDAAASFDAALAARFADMPRCRWTARCSSARRASRWSPAPRDGPTSAAGIRCTRPPPRTPRATRCAARSSRWTPSASWCRRATAWWPPWG